MTLEEQAIKVLDESASDSESNIVDELVQEFPALAGSLVKTINRRNKTNLEIPKKERISKNKILLDITSTLSKINGELIIVNSRIVAQNDLLRANIGFTSSSIGNLEYNDTLLTGKLDSVLEALKAQNEFMREQEEDQERDDISNNDIEDAAFNFGFKRSKGKNILAATIAAINRMMRSPLGSKLLGKYVLRPLLRRFAPGLADSLTTKGMVGTLRQFLPKWLGGTQSTKQLNLFDKPPKPNIVQRGAQWLNNTGMVKGTKEFIGPLLRPARSAIGNFMKDPIGNTKGFGKKLLNQAMGNKYLQRLGRHLPAISGNFGKRMIPGVGVEISRREMTKRIERGDSFGAWLAGLGMTSDAASLATSGMTFTGIGTVIPAGLQIVSGISDFGLLGYDLFRAFTDPDAEFEHGGVIQAPPILTPAEKGAVIGGSGSSDIGHIVNASKMILDTYGVTLSGTSNLLNDFPVDGSTGNLTINSLAVSKPVLEDEVKPKEKDSQTKENEFNIDTSNTSDTLESNDIDTTTVSAIDSQTTSDVTPGLGIKDGDNIAFNWKKPSDNIEQLRYRSDHPEGTEQPNPFKEGSTLYKNFEKLRMYDKAGMTISSVRGVNNVDVSNITPVTQTNNISDNISVNIDPTVKTKIVFVTKTIPSGGNAVTGGGSGDKFHVEVKDDDTKLSRMLLFA
mgnify:CR=1 FL=1|tara:strand:- start:8114 stop:10147 length:2034 start_codon:yes stop_codon:yes gene_type:complete